MKIFPIQTVPTGVDVLVWWPQRYYDENEMPCGDIAGGRWIVTRTDDGRNFNEPESMSSCGHYFDDDYEFSESPSHWTFAPPTPEGMEPKGKSGGDNS